MREIGYSGEQDDLAVPNGKTEAVSFRLDAASAAVLKARAEFFGKKSPGLLARQYVLECLMAEEERSALRQAVRALEGEIKTLRADFLLALEALLISAGKVEKEPAHEWIKKNFKTK